MRLAPTPAGRAVWRILRAAPFDAPHFRRQMPFANRYIADFTSHRAQIIIEIDGNTHELESVAEQARTAWLIAQGYPCCVSPTPKRQGRPLSRAP